MGVKVAGGWVSRWWWMDKWVDTDHWNRETQDNHPKPLYIWGRVGEGWGGLGEGGGGGGGVHQYQNARMCMSGI